MQDLFTLRADAAKIDLTDAIHSRFNKTKAILTSIMFSLEFIRDDMKLDNSTIYHALWAADGYLEELEVLFQRLEELH